MNSKSVATIIGIPMVLIPVALWACGIAREGSGGLMFLGLIILFLAHC